MTLTITDCLNEIKRINPGIKEEDITVFDDGWDYIVCVVRDSQTFRFPRRDDYSKTLPREVGFLKEFSKQSPVQVPELALSKMPSGYPYVTYSFIPGVQFKRDLAQSFTTEERHNIAKQIGHFLSVFHSFPIEKAKQFGFEELDSVKSWSDRLNKIKRVVYPHISVIEQEWITDLFTNYLKILSSIHFDYTLTHSDIMPEHIIVDSQTHKLVGIIDFGDVCITDPAYDFTFLNKYGRDFLNAAYDNYKLTRDEGFEQRRKFYEDRLVVTNLEHSLELKNKKNIELHKKQLREYVTGR